jgi:hypothetical protein
MGASYDAPRRSLPVGVAIISILIGLLAVLLLVASLVLFLFGGYLYFHDVAYFGSSLLGAVLLLIFSIVLFVVALGLWNLELWALVLSIVVVGILWVEDVVAGRLISLGGVILVLLLVYLIAVHRHFH